MWRYHSDLLATPVPRYTSFPTAADFVPGVGGADFATALSEIHGPVSLYLHIPFCERICWYCGCNTSAANHTRRLATYLEALHQEIALLGNLLPSHAVVSRICFGGGSPNAIPPIDFVRLIGALTVHFRTLRPTISVELDPRKVTDDWGEAIAGVGVSRASLGVQTFSDRLQTAIGRVQPAEQIENCVRLLRDAGVESLNFDLMYGLPGQHLDELDDTLRRTVALGPDRIALFGYAHVPHLIARQRKIDAGQLPDAEMRFAMAARGHDHLDEAGYVSVGFDHFALPGDPLAQASLSGRLHRNFQGFTDDQAGTTIGLGASAISSLPGLIVQNEKNTGRYRMLLSQGRLASACGIHRSAEDGIRGGIIEDLLCRGRAETSQMILNEVLPGLSPFLEKGLAAIDGREVVILPGGLPYSRAIAAQFDPYRRNSARRFSSAV